MHAKTGKAKILHYLEACFKVLTTKNEQVANIIDGNVQGDVLSHIPDNFQRVAEIVSDRLLKSSRADFVTDISNENSIKFFLRKQRGTSKNTFYLRPEDLSTKGLERFHGKWCKQKAAYQISV